MYSLSVSALVTLFLCALSAFGQPSSNSTPQGATPQSATHQSATLSGLVREMPSGEAAIGVNVVVVRDTSLPNTPQNVIRGTRTNKFGFYSITGIPEGTWFLTVRGVGVHTFVQTLPIKAGSDALRIDVSLESRNVRTQQITVEAKRDVRAVAQSVSKIDVSPQFLQQLPSIGGEKDVFRMLQLLPGVKASSDLSSGLNVRGGSSDQNLTLLDDAIIYNPSHLGGFLSTFNADALQDIKLMKGAFPAEYGGRLSSVIDLTMREGTREKISGSGAIGTLSSRFLLEGPIGENVTFMLSGRRMYLDLVLKALTSGIGGAGGGFSLPNYYFYDINGKTNIKLSDNDRIFLSGYLGQDVMDFSQEFLKLNLDWGNTSGNLRWMHIVSPSLFTNFSVIYTRYNYASTIGFKITDDKTSYFSTISQIQDWTARGEAQYTLNAEHTVKVGAEATHHTFRNYLATNFDGASSSLNNDNTVLGIEAAIYGQDEWEISPELALNLGLRAVYFGANNQFAAEPRIAASYNLGSNITLKGAFAVANQFVHLLTRNDVALPSDSWFPSANSILPSNSLQYVLGAETTLFDGEIFFSVEGYYKSMSNLYEYREDATFQIGSSFEKELTKGTGEAYGVEFFLQKRVGAFTGWLGYTLSWVQRTFPELNNGRTFFPRYDRRHDISLVLTYKFNDDWEAGLTWIYGTGQAFTMPSGRLDFQDINSNISTQNPLRAQYNYSERNGFRLPPVHRLDVSVTRYFQIFGVPFHAIVSVYNLYNRANPLSWYVDASNIDKTTGLQQPVIKQFGSFPLIPSISFGFRF